MKFEIAKKIKKWSGVIGFCSFIFIISVCPSASANHCSKLLLENNEFLDALKKAEKDDYIVLPLLKKVHDKPRLIILLGETHIKSTASAALGRDLLSYFEFIGVESFDPQKTWAGKIDAKLINPFLIRLGLKDRSQFWFIRTVEKLFGQKGRTEKSTIDEAEELFDQKKLNQIKNIYDLESDHVADVYENINSIEKHIILVACIAHGVVASRLLDQSSHEVSLEAAYAVVFFYLYKFTGNLLLTQFESKNWFRKFFPLSIANLHGRNKTMAKKIDKILENDSKVENLLIIVGKAHVREMSRILEQKGYSVIEGLDRD